MFKNLLTQYLRKFSYFNTLENSNLTDEFEDRVTSIKENNSQTVWHCYYLPKAINAILKEEGYLPTQKGAMSRATAMMMSDLADGTLDEFYRFKQVKE